MNSLITIKHPSKDVETHIANQHGGTDYATVCGCALDGDEYSGVEIKTPKSAKVTCDGCISIWQSCMNVRPGQIS